MLFKSSDKIKLYAQLTGTIDLASLEATGNFIEKFHLKPILGIELLAELKTQHTASTDDKTLADENMTDLLENCRRVVGPLICYYFAPKADVQLSDSGLQRSETTTNKTAYQYQSTAFKQANLSEAEACTEILLEYLEENSENFETWTNSDEYKTRQLLFIKSGAEFQKLFPAQTPYRNYFAMRAKMYDVEQINIKTLTGETLFEELKAEDLSDIKIDLVDKIKKAVAYYTVAFAIPFLNVAIDTNGISVLSAANFSTSDKENTRGGADQKAISKLIDACISAGETYLKAAVDFIKANPEELSTWTGFSVISVNNTIDSANQNLSGSFGLV